MENEKANLFLKILNSALYTIKGIYKKEKVTESTPQEITVEKKEVNNSFESIKSEKKIKVQEKSVDHYSSFVSKINSIQTPTETSDNENLTPFTLKKEFIKCSQCSLNSENRVLGDGKDFHPDVLVVTDTILSNDEREYLDNILSSVYVKSGRNAYITSLIKCETSESKDDISSCIDRCSAILNKQIKLLSPKAIIGFGKNSSQYLKKAKSDLNLSKTSFIYTLMPFEVRHNTEVKKRLWESLKKLAKLLSLPIKKG